MVEPEGWAAFDGSGDADDRLGGRSTDGSPPISEDYKDAMWAATDNGRGHMPQTTAAEGSTGAPNRLLRWRAVEWWSKSEIAVEALGQEDVRSRAPFWTTPNSITSTRSPATSTTRRCGRPAADALAVHDGGSAAFRRSA